MHTGWNVAITRINNILTHDSNVKNIQEWKMSLKQRQEAKVKSRLESDAFLKDFNSFLQNVEKFVGHRFGLRDWIPNKSIITTPSFDSSMEHASLGMQRIHRSVILKAAGIVLLWEAISHGKAHCVCRTSPFSRKEDELVMDCCIIHYTQLSSFQQQTFFTLVCVGGCSRDGLPHEAAIKIIAEVVLIWHWMSM